MPIYLTIKYISRSIIQQDTPPATVSTPSIYISRSISQQDTPPATVSTPSINIYIYLSRSISQQDTPPATISTPSHHQTREKIKVSYQIMFLKIFNISKNLIHVQKQETCDQTSYLLQMI